MEFLSDEREAELIRELDVNAVTEWQPLCDRGSDILDDGDLRVAEVVHTDGARYVVVRSVREDRIVAVWPAGDPAES